MSAIKLLVVLLFFYLCTSCEKEKDAESKVSLLANDSIKIWHLVKIEDKEASKINSLEKTRKLKV